MLHQILFEHSNPLLNFRRNSTTNMKLVDWILGILLIFTGYLTMREAEKKSDPKRRHIGFCMVILGSILSIGWWAFNEALKGN